MVHKSRGKNMQVVKDVGSLDWLLNGLSTLMKASSPAPCQYHIWPTGLDNILFLKQIRFCKNVCVEGPNFLGILCGYLLFWLHFLVYQSQTLAYE